MRYDVAFPGGVAVEASAKGHTIRTDQPEPFGSDSAPAPFDLFIASIATCMGYYALRFCQERGIPTEGLGLSVETVKDPEKKRLSTIRAVLTLPPGFPEKYAGAIQRAVDQCAVKKHLVEPPAFELTVN
ncbi:MAG TPA: OsmC family protein [Thermoanaerobaculia bacterium]|nr:OsmC family protein [Thermoanaerobaculia bacterium]